MKTIIYLAITAFLFPSFCVFAQEKTNPSNQSVELGKVRWYRNYDDAVRAGKKEHKDLVILFQEVPGCITCRNYGHHVLTHPLMVEALENSFIPLVIFNNKGGSDRNTLQKFNEPAWNNPVVRIIDVNGRDVVKRISGDYSATTLIKRLNEALSKRGVATPLYMDLLEKELTATHSNNIEESTYSMYCFWNGEKQLGKKEGVMDVESGFAEGKEVVKVKYNKALINQEELNDYAQKQGFQSMKNVENYRKSGDDIHYYLQHSIYKFLPLSELQKIKINSALGDNQVAEKYLSPQQRKWLMAIQHREIKKAYLLSDKKLEDAWKLMEAEIQSNQK